MAHYRRELGGAIRIGAVVRLSRGFVIKIFSGNFVAFVRLAVGVR